VGASGAGVNKSGTGASQTTTGGAPRLSTQAGGRGDAAALSGSLLIGRFPSSKLRCSTKTSKTSATEVHVARVSSLFLELLVATDWIVTFLEASKRSLFSSSRASLHLFGTAFI
jgi:hypothetical protein